MNLLIILIMCSIQSIIGQQRLPWLIEDDHNYPIMKSTLAGSNYTPNGGAFTPKGDLRAQSHALHLQYAGIQIKAMPLTARGKTSVTLHGAELAAGMYLYTLVADGK